MSTFFNQICYNIYKTIEGYNLSIIVIVKKDKEIVIASDSLTSRGTLNISSQYKINNEKFIKYQNSWIGCDDYAMPTQMLLYALKNREDELSFDGIDNIYTSMLKLHKTLKKKYFLNPKQKENQIVQSTKMRLVIANSSGIYRVDEDKHIDNFSKFWAIGTGGTFALGAMHHVYDKYDATKIAKIGVKTACEFDEGCGLPIHIQTIKEKICQS